MATHQVPHFLYEGTYTVEDLGELKKNPIRSIYDIYEHQLKELFEITYPSLRFSLNYQEKLSEFIREKTKGNSVLSGSWVYFPWNQTLLHIVTEPELFALRTNRNKNLITLQEQDKLAQYTIGVVGLSVGNTIVLSLAYNGISNTMKLADNDTLETTNLNRIRAGLPYVGVLKTEVTAQQVYDINPYAMLTVFSHGLTKDNLPSFLIENPVPRLIFEAIDDFEMKIRLRLAAREEMIPIVMLTNLGDRVLIDIERYDLDRTTPLFNGLIGKTAEEILSKPITEADKQRYAVQIVGKENVPKRALESLPEINKTLVGRPQLMSTVTIAGGIGVYLARRIALGEPVPSGRNIVKFAEL